MREIRIYQDTDLQIGKTLQLDKTAANHVLNVLRLSANDPLTLFNGKGGEFVSHINHIDKNSVSVTIDQHLNINKESSLNIHLAQGVSRGEKMDFAIQKAVELGVKTITPLLTERCGVQLSKERWQKKIAHWENIIISACEQCGRNDLPNIQSVSPLKEWISTIQSDTKLIFHHKATQQLSSLKNPQKEIAILIGPEGGFSEDEIEYAKHHNFQVIQLGPRVLRTETAGVACIAALQTLFGDFV